LRAPERRRHHAAGIRSPGSDEPAPAPGTGFSRFVSRAHRSCRSHSGLAPRLPFCAATGRPSSIAMRPGSPAPRRCHRSCVPR
jgi:hypothetical protein